MNLKGKFLVLYIKKADEEYSINSELYIKFDDNEVSITFCQKNCSRCKKNL